MKLLRRVKWSEPFGKIKQTPFHTPLNTYAVPENSDLLPEIDIYPIEIHIVIC